MKFAKVMNAVFGQFTGLFTPSDFVGYKKLKSSIKKISKELTHEGSGILDDISAYDLWIHSMIRILKVKNGC